MFDIRWGWTRRAMERFGLKIVCLKIEDGLAVHNSCKHACMSGHVHEVQ